MESVMTVVYAQPIGWFVQKEGIVDYHVSILACCGRLGLSTADNQYLYSVFIHILVVPVLSTFDMSFNE